MEPKEMEDHNNALQTFSIFMSVFVFSFYFKTNMDEI